jgi:hypothetical protein
MVSDDTWVKRFWAAVWQKDLSTAESEIAEHIREVDQETLNDWLAQSADENDVATMKMLVRYGADVDAPVHPPEPEGPIKYAAGENAIDAVRWLIAQGARVNYMVNGQTRCSALTHAVLSGNFEMVRLLIEEGGAEINATWADQNALFLARMYGLEEIEAYLLDHGATMPAAVGHPGPADHGNIVLAHYAKHFGSMSPLRLTTIIPSDNPVSIHASPQPDQNLTQLLTLGMSDWGMKVPAGGDDHQFAELTLALPSDWPLGNAALKNPKTAWPIEWMMKIAQYPKQNDTWLGGKSAIFASGEKLKPLGPGTKMTCWLLLDADTDWCSIPRPGGGKIVVYTMLPIYTVERDFELEHGIVPLLKRFQERDVPFVLDPKRPCVVR